MRRWLLLSVAVLLLLALSGCSIEFGVEPQAVAQVGATGDGETPVTAPAQPTLTRTPRPSPTLAPTRVETSTPASPPAPTRSSSRPAPTAPPTATPPPTATFTSTPSPTVTPTRTPAVEPPAVLLFDVSPAEARPGDTVTLSWRAVGETIAVRTVLASGADGPLYSDLPAEGVLHPALDTGQGTDVTFVLEVAALGRTTTSQIRVSVLCLDEWFFANPPGGCPRGPATTAQAAGQYFERGFMIWEASDDEITVFYEDSTGGYATFADEWDESLPEKDPSLTPPRGLYQPVRGFGLVWRTQPGSPVADTVRARIGWALFPEFAFETVEQCDAQAQGRNPGLNCYQLAPDGRVIVLQEGRWWYYEGPEP